MIQHSGDNNMRRRAPFFRGISSLTIGLCLFFLLNTFAVNYLLWKYGGQYNETGLSQTKKLLRGLRSQIVLDSWTPMELALQQVRQAPDKTLYDELFFENKTKFQYPPSALVTLQLVMDIRNNLKTFGVSIRDVLCVLDELFLLLQAVFTALLLDIGIKRFADSQTPEPSRLDSTIRGFLVILMTLTFYPVAKAFTLGQIQVWINSLFAVAVWCWARGQKTAPGCIMGFLCLIKPQYGLVLIWGLLRKQWRFVAAMAVIGGAGLALSFSQYGWQNHADYLGVLSFLSKHGESYYPNQSVNGLLGRVWGICHPHLFNNLEWQANSFPPFNLFIYAGTITSSLVFIGLALFVRQSNPRNVDITDFCLIALASTLASPIAWEHHYGILLPIYAILLPDLMNKGRWGSLPMVWLGISYFLTSNFYAIAKAFAYTSFNFVQSYLLFGALIIFILLYKVRHRREVNRNEMETIPARTSSSFC